MVLGEEQEEEEKVILGEEEQQEGQGKMEEETGLRPGYESVRRQLARDLEELRLLVESRRGREQGGLGELGEQVGGDDVHIQIVIFLGILKFSNLRIR